MHDKKDFAVPANRYGEDVEAILIGEEELQNRVQELADMVSEKYADAEQDLLLVCVLKGAAFFLTDFARKLSIPSELEFMAVSSYGASTSSSGVVRILKDLDRDIAGRNVLIVEDIIDSGNTLSKVLEILHTRNPNSIQLCTLVSKPSRREINLDVQFLGFEVEDKFIVGYGLDYDQKYRHLPFIGEIGL